MTDVFEVLDMLDWNMPAEIQSAGIELAKSNKDIKPFIQPLTPKHNKNVWGNCAIIVSTKSDGELDPYLIELLEWIQDLNWPGAFCIFDRLQKYSDNCTINSAINICLDRAKSSNDESWQNNLCMLAEKLNL